MAQQVITFMCDHCQKRAIDIYPSSCTCPRGIKPGRCDGIEAAWIFANWTSARGGKVYCSECLAEDGWDNVLRRALNSEEHNFNKRAWQFCAPMRESIRVRSLLTNEFIAPVCRWGGALQQLALTAPQTNPEAGGTSDATNWAVFSSSSPSTTNGAATCGSWSQQPAANQPPGLQPPAKAPPPPPPVSLWASNERVQLLEQHTKTLEAKVDHCVGIISELQAVIAGLKQRFAEQENDGAKSDGVKNHFDGAKNKKDLDGANNEDADTAEFSYCLLPMQS